MKEIKIRHQENLSIAWGKMELIQLLKIAVHQAVKSPGRNMTA
jgi:hypothetical protein